MRVIIIIIFLLVSQVTIGQTVTLKGLLIDTLFPYNRGDWPVSVNLFISKTDSIIASTETDKNRFVFKDIPKGNYRLYFSMCKGRDEYHEIVLIDSVTSSSFIYPGPCPYLLYGSSVPFCPIDPSDKLIPYSYRKRTKKALKGQYAGKFKIGRRPKSDCEPNYYCKRHGIDL